MDVHLPYFFAVKFDNGYKLFRNTVGIDKVPVNIVWPEGIYTIGHVFANDSETTPKSIFLRSWDASEYSLCSWSYDNKEVEMISSNNSINVPIINFLHMHLLPEKSQLLYATGFESTVKKACDYWAPQVYT